MPNKDLILAKLGELSEYLDRIALSAPARLKHDRDALDVVAFNIMLSVQCCMDIASHGRHRGH